MTAPPRTAGYTLLELMIVLLIVGVLVGIAVVRFGPAFEQTRVRGAANLIATDLQLAQVLAARERAPIVLTVNPAARTYQITTRAADTVYQRRDFGAGTDYEVGSLTATSTTVEFYPTGFASGSATWTVTLNDHTRQVQLSRAGQIRISVP